MKNFKYIAIVLVGGSMYGMLSSFVKLSYVRGFNAAEISFFQALLAALFLGICALPGITKSGKPKLKVKECFFLLLTGSAIGLTNYLYYQSVYYISASLAIVILMQFTWFSLFLEWIFFRKKPSRAEVVTIFFILGGTVLAGNLLDAEVWTFSWKGIGFVLLASITYAVYIVANSRVGKHVRWQAKSTLIMSGSALTIFPVNFHTLLEYNHFGYEFLRWALFLAVLGTTIPTALFAVGIPKIGAGVSSILMTIELPVAIICAHYILKEQINFTQILGILIMLLAISTMNYYKSMTVKKRMQ